MTYMSKIIYANMDVNSFFKTSTIQLAALKLLNVHFDIFNTKMKKMSNFFCIFRNFLCIFHVLCA